MTSAESTQDRPDEMRERIVNRTLELIQKKRRTQAEETELAILTYDGPVPRRLPPSDEAPF